MMRRLLLLLLFVFIFLASSARAQYTTTTNLGMKLPNSGLTLGWDTMLNGDLSQLDTILGGYQTLPVNSVTPSINGYTNWVTANTSPTAYTNFTGGFQGQLVRIFCGDTNTTISSGSNIVVTSMFTCASNYSISFVLRGTTWYETAINVNSGGSSIPGGSDTYLQLNKSNTFAAYSSLAVDNSTTPTQLKVGLDMNILGPDPYIDVRQYGGRGVALGGFGTTGSITASTNALSLTSASNFQNGDGIRIVGAGASCSLSTPGSVTITPGIPETNGSLSPVGAVAAASSTYSYAIIALDKNGCYTPASSTATITNGPATLGAYSSSVSTLSRSNDVITVTLTTAPSVPIVVGSYVHLSGSTDATFTGWFNVTSVSSSTVFSMKDTPIDTRAGGSTSATGGTAAYFVVNKLSWTAVSNAWEYGVYVQRPGDGSMHLINVTIPSYSTFTVVQYNDMGTMSDAVSTILPDYLPSAPPVSGQNDYLVTTITSGGGTTSLILHDSALNTATSQSVEFTNGPAYLAAANASTVAFGSCVYTPIPSPSQSFVINSFLLLPGNTKMCQAGQIQLLATLETQGGGTQWSGVGRGTSGDQFSYGSYPVVLVGSASPGVYALSGGSFDHLAFKGTSNGNLLFMTSGGISITGNYLDFVTAGGAGGGNADLTSVGLILGSGFAIDFQHTLWSAAGGTNDSSWMPEVYMPPGTTGANVWNFKNDYCNRRCLSQDGGASFSIDHLYSQALLAPMLVEAGLSGSNVMVGHINDVVDDTGIAPLFAASNAGSELTGELTIENATLSQDVAGTPPLVTGTRIPDLKSFNGQSSPGQNRSSFTLIKCLPDVATFGAVFQQCLNINDTVMVQPPYTMNWTMPVPTGLAINFTTGGSVSTGSHTYGVTAVGFNGNETATSQRITVTVSSGTQTLNASWTPQAGAVSYNVYDTSVNTLACSSSTASCVVASYGCCTNSTPASSAAGLASIDSTQVIAPKFVMYSPIGGNQISYSGTILETNTANRTYTFPDSTGIVCLTTTGCGSGTVNFLSQSSNFSAAVATGYEVTTGSSSITVTIPAASSSTGTIFVEKVDSGSGTVVLSPSGGTIDGASTFTLTAQWQFMTLQSDGSNWVIISRN